MEFFLSAVFGVYCRGLDGHLALIGSLPPLTNVLNASVLDTETGFADEFEKLSAVAFAKGLQEFKHCHNHCHNADIEVHLISHTFTGL